MKKLTQPRKLRRSFGSQPVGNVDGPRWPKAGITTQEIPALPSWVTFREVQSPTADLPNLVNGDTAPGVFPRPQIRRFAYIFINGVVSADP